MKPTTSIAKHACESAKARQAVVVWFDEHGQSAIAFYGETESESSAVKPVCNVIADMSDASRIAQHACQSAEAQQVVVVWFDEHGRFTVTSYNETANRMRSLPSRLWRKLVKATKLGK